ncbi:uncharacterized protein FA14DRAFT_184415 [Meira miltonrushii]|uniref:Uncharacterized protein n=1 Tax=Meira miltonrushii TaxID=1280837 RepID=A0A316VC48_9BASI|nr:uncharacterized protein FA14DRAFT_184415 [Meira miltonrushii]PWN35050.1 hypothetical protein FA14DRAFT_184415 [Meira miltonrushii]
MGLSTYFSLLLNQTKARRNKVFGIHPLSSLCHRGIPIMSLSKRSASLLLRISPSFLNLATITVLSITLVQAFEKTDPGRRWKEWLTALSEQPTKLDKWEDDYIMERLKNHQTYFSDLDFQTESESSDEGDTVSEPSPSSSQELAAGRYKLKLSLQRSVSLPNIPHSPAKDVENNKRARVRIKTSSHVQPSVVPDNLKEPSSSVPAESSADPISAENSFSDISMLQLSYIEAQNPWTIVDRRPKQ